MSILSQIGLTLASSIGFATSTIVLSRAIESNSQSLLIAGLAALLTSYLPWLQLLSTSMSSTVVVTGLLSQSIVIFWAIGVVGEPLTWMRGCGLALALGAVIAFSVPTTKF